MDIHAIKTPSLLLDLARAKRNAARIAEIAALPATRRAALLLGLCLGSTAARAGDEAAPLPRVAEGWKVEGAVWCGGPV